MTIDPTAAHQAIDGLVEQAAAKEAVLIGQIESLSETLARTTDERDRALADLAICRAGERRFPGDPGPGRIVLGEATAGGYPNPLLTGTEQAVGKRLIHRRYWNNGPSDLAVPTGPVAKALTEYASIGRSIAVSVKLGSFGSIASGTHDTALSNFFAWAEKLTVPVYFIVNHEPENDHAGETAAQQLAAAERWRADQKRVRTILNGVTAGKPQRVTFGGSLMTYTWTADAKSKGFAPPDSWFPGGGVWDWCGLDQYAQESGTPILDAKYAAATASIKSWGVPLAVTELGIRSSDPDSGRKLKGFHDDLLARGGVFLLYYDSDANSTAEGWVLTGAQLSAWRALFFDPANTNPLI